MHGHTLRLKRHREMKILTLPLAILVALPLTAKAVEAPQSSPLGKTPGSTKKEANPNDPERPHGLTTLDRVQVIGQRLFPYQEGMVLTERYIEEQTRGNGDIATLLRINPNVQFDDSATASSNRMGEIRPAEISINGGQYYQNLFQVDSAGFNNDLDPRSSNPHHFQDIPSTSQGIALDTELIGELTVYDSNVPVAFGGFNGGVVDVQSRQARNQFAGKASLRMSRSVWNEMILADGNEQSIAQSTSYTNQPRYDKYRVAMMLEGRSPKGLGWIANVIRTRSDIPLRGYSGGNISSDDDFTKQQRRENTSASMRLDWASERLNLRASINHAPTDERYFTQNAKNSYFDLKQGGPVISLNAGLKLANWQINQTLSYNDLDSSRRVQPGIDYWKSWARSEAFAWGTNNSSFEGNWGNVDQRTRNASYGINFQREALKWGISEHRLQAGFQFRDRLANYQRINDHYSYLNPSATTSCTTASGVIDTDACSLSPVITSTSGGLVAGRGQYFRTMNIYSSGQFQVRVREQSMFIQNDARIGHWSLRGGLRLDSDDMMDKNTLSPRLALSWDVFGNQNTLLTAGVNRYYGRSFFAYKLREGRENLQTRYIRNAKTLEWQADRQFTANNRFESLKIPFSDELNIGLNQRWRGLDINLKHVRRDGRDEVLRQRLASNNDSGYYSGMVYQYINAGRSRSETSTLSIGLLRPWLWYGSHTHMQFAFDHTDVRRNYIDYESAYNDGSYNRWVRYEGELIRAYALPQGSYNRPWTVRFSTQTRIESLGLLWSNFLRYRAGYFGYATIGNELHEGEAIDVIERYQANRSFSMDSTVEYSRSFRDNQQAYVRVEIQNILNRANALTGTATHTAYYEPGRSYWLELGYRF